MSNYVSTLKIVLIFGSCACHGGGTRIAFNCVDFIWRFNGAVQTGGRTFRRNSVKRTNLLLGLLLTSFAPLPAKASSSSGGYVQSLSIGNDGSVWFAYTGTHWGTSPSCAEPNGLWVVSASSAGSQKLLSALMTAVASKRKISIQGTGACYGTHEEVAYVTFEE